MAFADSIAHTIIYLTEPLSGYCSPAALVKLTSALQANLASSLSATWELPYQKSVPRSSKRVFSFSRGSLPPQPIQQACLIAGIRWHEWCALLEHSEFDLIIEPHCVYVYVASTSTCLVIWSEEHGIRARASAQVMRALHKAPPVVNIACTSNAYTTAEEASMLTARMPPTAAPKTLAQRLLEDDEEGTEEVFSLLNNAMLERSKAPSGPALLDVPDWSRSTAGHHSRSSSLGSMMSCGSVDSLTLSSVDSSSASSVCDDSVSSCGSNSQSRRRRNRNRHDIYVDSSKTDVTPYDGGRTTVLTGGVMLGMRQNRGDQRCH